MLESIPVENGEYEFKYENNLTDNESREYYLAIKDCLCESTYACGMVLQDMAYRTR